MLRFCQINENAESELLLKLKDTRSDFAGALRIAGFSSVNRSLVIPALRRIAIENPRLSIHLATREIRELEELLRKSEADYIVTTQATDASDIQSILLGHEENVLVRSKKHADSRIFLDHDKDDPTTRAYFAQSKLKMNASNRRYLDDVYSLIDGVKNGYGKAVLPLHLIAHERDLETEEPKKVLKVPIYLQFYAQPYYRGIHSHLLTEVQTYFQKHLNAPRQL